jgi:hypothetical protein
MKAKKKKKGKENESEDKDKTWYLSFPVDLGTGFKLDSIRLVSLLLVSRNLVL